MKRLVDSLPPQREADLRRARRLQWTSLAVMSVIIAVVGVTTGSSQAMQAAWIEDILALIPPALYLFADRLERRPASRRFPYGLTRAHSIGFLLGAAALVVMGGLLVWEAVGTLVRGERPSIEWVSLFGETVWFGWVMMAVLAASAVGPVVLGRRKHALATALSDKLLHTDALMNKADWMTAGAGVVGIAGIGLGLWWADAVAAGLIGLDVLRDGLRASRIAFVELADGAPRCLDSADVDPVVDQATARVHRRLPSAEVRVRETGRFLRFTVVADGLDPGDAERIVGESLGDAAWRLAEVSVARSAPVGRPSAPRADDERGDAA